MLKPFYILLAPALLAVLLTAGCGRGPQCQQASDCRSKGPCFESLCSSGICKTAPIDDCCGNGICEGSVADGASPLIKEPPGSDNKESSTNTLLDIASEDGNERTPIENACTCPEDCGKCEGAASYIAEDGDPVAATYIRMQCTDFRTCEPAYSKIDQYYSNEYREINFNGIVFDVILRYPNAIVTNRDSIDIELKIVEINDARITYPVTITSARVLDDAIMFGENLNKYTLDAAEDSVEIAVPIHEPGKKPEERHQLNLQLGLEYFYLEEMQMIENGLLVYDIYGRPVMRTVTDNLIKKNLVLNLEEEPTIIDLRSSALNRANP